jgi:mono/diheme cytochrome c family protein
MMKTQKVLAVVLLAIAWVAPVARPAGSPVLASSNGTFARSNNMLAQGRNVFRFSTFGDQAFWGDTLKLHQAIAGTKFRGVGPGLSPKSALAVGLKVDVDALPPSLIQQMQQVKVNLNDPAVTLALLQFDSVVGVTGFFNPDGSLKSMGIQCALCHSTVDNSFSPGIGHRLDGWANRDLNVGEIVSLAPNLQPFADLLGVDQATVRQVLQSWGPGHFDAELALDGKAFRPDGKTSAVLIPPAFGLAGVNLHTWTGWVRSPTGTRLSPIWKCMEVERSMIRGSTMRHSFRSPAKAGFGHVNNVPDLITPQLAALHFYQLALKAPAPPQGSFNQEAAQRGQMVFNGAGKCSGCHVPPLYTEAGWNMHTPEEVCVDSFQADRAPDKRYRTTPLSGLWPHTNGGFYHDGRFSTLMDVVHHYDSCMNLALSDQNKTDLVEFLKSLPQPASDKQ